MFSPQDLVAGRPPAAATPCPRGDADIRGGSDVHSSSCFLEVSRGLRLLPKTVLMKITRLLRTAIQVKHGSATRLLEIYDCRSSVHFVN